jgi:hypothetical protein
MKAENTSNEWDCSSDIEVAFIGLDADKFFMIIDDFKMKDYSLEDKTSSGWGCVISRNDEWIGDKRKLSNLIGEFLTEIDDVIRIVHDKYPEIKPVLRVGVYYSSYTLTLPFSQESIKSMEQADIDFELSLYPTQSM